MGKKWPKVQTEGDVVSGSTRYRVGDTELSSIDISAHEQKSLTVNAINAIGAKLKKAGVTKVRRAAQVGNKEIAASRIRGESSESR